jgi:cyclophilin family peptidyl-prolyl cis-trans isomerase
MLGLLVLGTSVVPAARAEEERVVPTSPTPLVLDGRPDEPGWTEALVLPAQEVTVPALAAAALDPQPATAAVTPEVRVTLSDGRLWIGVRVAEAPGTAMGLRAMLAPDGIRTAAEALALSYSPQDLRSPLYTARGPQGVGRALYGIEGAADVARGDAWSLEFAIPLGDLGDLEPRASLRLALVVTTRTPNVISWAPPGAAWKGPALWFELEPPVGGWPTGSEVDRGRFAAEDAREAQKQEAWLAFLKTKDVSLEEILLRRNVTADGEGRFPRAALLEAVNAELLAPLAVITDLRPELAHAHYLRGDLLRRMGLEDEALEALAAAREAVPGYREATYAEWVRIRGPGIAEGPLNGATDYPAALGRLTEAGREAEGRIAEDGLAYAQALLLYKRGELGLAQEILDPLATRYPFDAGLVASAERTRTYGTAWPRELQYRAREAERDDLPRVQLAFERDGEARGTVLLELFEDDAPNTVKNFVWLADHGFYDGTTIHRTVPFLLAQGGDPFTAKADGAADGAGGPGYRIPLEVGEAREGRQRRPFRGVIAMASAGPDSEGSQFFITTGTAAHLEGEFSVFGRVLEGQSVVEGLVAGDRLAGVEVLRRRPDSEYRPRTTEGLPAPEPAPTR